MTFGEFEIDEAAGELRHAGVRVRLQDLPFRMLVVLAGRPGEVVTREELRAALWGAETFVDAEAGLNTAIGKLREALGDSAESPRFIETIPKRGYRFIGPATSVAATVQTAPARPYRLWFLAGLVVLAVVAAGVYWRPRQAAPISMAVVRFHNETGDAANDRIANDLTDAVVVFLTRNARYEIMGNAPVLRTERIFEDVQKIGTALSAEYVILGQLQQGDNGLILRAHFIRVSDQKHLWAHGIDLGASGREEAATRAVAGGIETGLARAGR